MMLEQEKQAREYKELLDTGFISQGEYLDLIEDLKREVDMIDDTNLIELKADCFKALNMLSKLI